MRSFDQQHSILVIGGDVDTSSNPFGLPQSKRGETEKLKALIVLNKLASLQETVRITNRAKNALGEDLHACLSSPFKMASMSHSEYIQNVYPSLVLVLGGGMQELEAAFLCRDLSIPVICPKGWSIDANTIYGMVMAETEMFFGSHADEAKDLLRMFAYEYKDGIHLPYILLGNLQRLVELTTSAPTVVYGGTEISVPSHNAMHA